MEICIYMFALSQMEYTGDGDAEGSHILYFDSDSKRIAYGADGVTPQTIWTRTVTGGMADYSKAVYTDGTMRSMGVKSAYPLRPACCVKSDIVLTQDDEGRYIL